jgi:hypothetical protein
MNNFIQKIKKMIVEQVENELMLKEGIVHIENMKPQQLLSFLKTWNLDKAKFHVSEKMDGNYMAFGLNGGQFYLRSKSKVFTSADQVPNIFFMYDFKKFFELLKDVPWDEIVKQQAAKYNFQYDGTFEIEGEAIPSFDHNIVIYEEVKIGDGVFVIFNTKISTGKDKSGRITNPEMWNDIATEANKYSTIKFFSVPTIDLADLEFDNSLIVDLEKIIEENGNILAKPARKPAEKELKEKLLAKVLEIGKSAKNQALQMNVQSKFGPETEGFVIASPSGEMVKIVDVDKFTKRKELNWHFIDQIIDAERIFKKSVKENPESFFVSLEAWEQAIKEIKADFDVNGNKFITINKKFSDTENSVQYALGLINNIKEKVSSGQKPEEVMQDFLNKKIVPEGKNWPPKYVEPTALTEGGNVFDKSNSMVPKVLLDPNIENAMKMANLEGLEYEIIGNKNKELFGDIDIATEEKSLNQFLDASSIEELWKKLDQHLASSKVEGYSINKGLRQFHVLAPLVDYSGEQIPAIKEDGSINKNEPGLIQVDVFVGSLQWMRDIDSGAPIDSKYKAVYRNLLLSSISSIVRWTEKGDSKDTYNRYVMNFREGLKRQKIKVVPPTGKKKVPSLEKIADEVITTNANDLAEILFGSGIKWSNLNSYEELIKLILSNKFKFKKFLPEILQDYKTNIAKRGLEVPKELT